MPEASTAWPKADARWSRPNVFRVHVDAPIAVEWRDVPPDGQRRFSCCPEILREPGRRMTVQDGRGMASRRGHDGAHKRHGEESRQGRNHGQAESDHGIRPFANALSSCTRGEMKV